MLTGKLQNFFIFRPADLQSEVKTVKCSKKLFTDVERKQ